MPRPKGKAEVEKYEDARMGIMTLSNEERIATVWSARLSGMTYNQIYYFLQERFGASLPPAYSVKNVEYDIQTAFSQLPQVYGETAKDMVAIENARFDRMLNSIWSKVEDGDTRAVDTALAISRERRKMLGLDEPEKFQVDWRITLAQMVQGGELTPAQIVDEFGEEVLVEVNEKLLELK